jgi:hypothetical protein
VLPDQVLSDQEVLSETRFSRRPMFRPSWQRGKIEEKPLVFMKAYGLPFSPFKLRTQTETPVTSKRVRTMVARTCTMSSFQILSLVRAPKPFDCLQAIARVPLQDRCARHSSVTNRGMS